MSDAYPHECVPTQEAYDAACAALEKHRARADDAEADLARMGDAVIIVRKSRERITYELKEFRDKLAALAACEDYMADSGENAARNIRDLLAGTGEHNNDPRVQARAWGLEW